MTTEFKPTLRMTVGVPRSGTNWVFDVFNEAQLYDEERLYLKRDRLSALNEPISLSNPMGTSLSPMRYSGKEHASKEFGHSGFSGHPYSALVNRQLLQLIRSGGVSMKETHILALKFLLNSIPLQLVVTHRDPRSSIASVLNQRNKLYQKWHLAHRLEEFISTVMTTPHLQEYRDGVVSWEYFRQLEPFKQLTFFYAVLTRELNSVTKDYKNKKDVEYENLIANPEKLFRELYDFFHLPWTDEIALSIRQRQTASRLGDAYSTFGGRSSERINDILTADQLAFMSDVLRDYGILLPKITGVFRQSPLVFENKSKKREHIEVDFSERTQAVEDVRKKSILIKDGNHKDLFVQSTVTTNFEYARFLQWLVDHDIPLSINGRALFYSDSRNDLIKNDNGHIYIDKDKINYPVTHINWIAASIYSAWINGRLATSEEWEYAIIGSLENIDKLIQSGNTSQLYGSTTYVTQFTPNEKGLYDACGNVDIWLAETIGIYEALKAGLSWNHDKGRGVVPNSRFIWYGTSGLGVRVVSDPEKNPMPENIFLEKVQTLIELVTQHHKNDEVVNKQLFSLVHDLFYN